ncbi:hypothetical protein N7495_007311 [Penicillium taxi]|uniref:uncharacterized protein n=1 Tax=Penicillium taxi TaxID=168475 RepID=UPI0025452DF3|nr:uncharacterized protein N7495_007311 [Penicillium taxi]KAJ5895620.1 hypothetical protein N7495_007311 [Penicillium taxi]
MRFLLGQTIYVFNVLNAPYSNTAYSIVRNAFLSVKRWLPRLIKFPVMYNITMTPLMLDTVECLVHRTVPIIRLPRPGRIIIDRYTGIYATHLSNLYDICEYGCARKQIMLRSESGPSMGGNEPLYEIEQLTRDWEPPRSPTLFDDLRPHEIKRVYIVLLLCWLFTTYDIQLRLKMRSFEISQVKYSPSCHFSLR